MGVVIRQSFKATIVSYSGAVIGALLVILVYPKCLTPEQIGLTRVLTEASMLFSFFAQIGMSSFAIKFFPYFKDSSRQHNGFFFIITVIPLIGFVLFTLIFLLFRQDIASLFAANSSLLNHYLLYLIPLTLFWIYITVFETYASLLQRIVVPKLIKEILVRILTIAIILFFFFRWINLDQFILFFSAIYGLAAILNLYYISRIQPLSLKPSFSFITPELRRQMGSFMLFMMVVGVGSNIANKIDVFIVSQKISLTGTGIFTIAFFIASFIEMPSRAMYQITTPFVSEALKNNDMPMVGSLYRRVAINQLLIAGFIFLLLWTNVGEIFKIMPNGHLYESGKYVVFFIGLAKVFDAATGINASILGNSRYYYYILFFIFILSGLAIMNNLLFIPDYGIVGSAIATAISIFLYNLIMVVFVWWKLKVQPFNWNTVKAVLLVTITGFAAWYLPLTGHSFIDIFLRSGFISIVFLLLMFRLKISPDINQLIETIIGRIKLYLRK